MFFFPVAVRTTHASLKYLQRPKEKTMNGYGYGIAVQPVAHV